MIEAIGFPLGASKLDLKLRSKLEFLIRLIL